MKENILKHFQYPEEDTCWRERLERYLSESASDTHPLMAARYLCEDFGSHRVTRAIESICDRCEALEAELARLREELAKSRLTWSDEVPTEEGWYWVRPEGSSDWIHYLNQFILDRERRRKDDDKSMRFCRIPEPQEPSE